jgi:hypothetical protein
MAGRVYAERICSGVNSRGESCKARPLKGRDVCLRHSMSDEEWKATSARGIAKSARQRKLAAQAAKQRTKAPDDATLQYAAVAIARLLTATHPNGEPNMPWQVVGLVLFAKIYAVDDPEAALERFEEALGRTLPQLQRRRLLEERDSARERIRELVKEGRVPKGLIPHGILSRDELEELGLTNTVAAAAV